MPKPKQVTSRRKSRIGNEIENASYAATATISLDDDDFYHEPIKRIVRPDNQVIISELSVDRGDLTELFGTAKNYANRRISLKCCIHVKPTF